MKEINKEEFFSQLNSCEYGHQYLELVNNPKNHLGKKESGEVHHIHPRSLGGDLKASENLVKLTTFNHCLAHLYLAEAAMYLHSSWCGETLMMLNRLSTTQFSHLSELEQITFPEIERWTELRALGYKIAGQNYSDNWKKKSEEEKQIFRDKIKENQPDRSGENHPMYGKHHTKESREKNSLAHLNKEPGNKGKKENLSEESRNKMRLAHLGKEPWNKGKKMDENFRNKIKENQPDRSGKNNPMYGKPGVNSGKHRVYKDDGTYTYELN